MKRHWLVTAGLVMAMAAMAQPAHAKENKTAPGPAVDVSKLDTDAKKADARPSSNKIKIGPLKKLKDMTDK